MSAPEDLPLGKVLRIWRFFLKMSSAYFLTAM